MADTITAERLSNDFGMSVTELFNALYSSETYAKLDGSLRTIKRLSSTCKKNIRDYFFI